MAERLLYCRYPDCGGTIVVRCGDLPVQCPHCLIHHRVRAARWSTMPGRFVKARKGPQPRRAYALTFNDRRFLRLLHIDPEVIS